MMSFLKRSTASKGRCVGNIDRHRSDEIRNVDGFAGDRSIWFRRTGIMASKCDDTTSGDSMTIT